MDQEQITLPAGAWSAISQLLRGSVLNLTTDQAAELSLVLRNAKIEPVAQDDAPDK